MINSIQAGIKTRGTEVTGELLEIDHTKRGVHVKALDSEVILKSISTMVTLKFWEMFGMNLTQVEDTYNFDFIIGANGVPVVSNGKFAIQVR